MTTTKTELELLIENLTMEDILYEKEEEEKEPTLVPTKQNLHLLLKYEFDITDDGETSMTVSWDEDNEILEDLIDMEVRPDLGVKLNLLWIEKIKEKLNWKIGDKKVYMFLKKNTDGYFVVWYSYNNQFSSCILETSGYVCRRHYNMYNTDESPDDDIKYSFFIRSDCLYNDLICLELRKNKKTK